jgi:hypothetical protein
VSTVEKGSVEAILLDAVGRGEFTVDVDSPSWFRRLGAEIDYDLYSKLDKLSRDGFLTYDDAAAAPVVLTDAGRQVLS